MNILNSLTSALQKAGLRLTPQRIFLCRLLSDGRSHPTAGDLHRQLQAQFPSLSLMTVYNTLNALVALGAVNELGCAGDEQLHYDGNLAPHINLACLACHQISDLDSPLAARLSQQVGQSSGFQIRGTRLLYYGLCPACQQTQATAGTQ